MPRRKVNPVGKKRLVNTTGKKVKIIGSEEYTNSATGEVKDFQVIDIEDRDFNFHKLWLGHIINSLDLIGNQKTKLAFWIIEQLDYENKLCMTYRQIAEKSGISLQTVSRTMQALQECNFIQAINQGSYRVNPDVVFKGSRTNRLNVLYQYHTSEADTEGKEKALVAERERENGEPTAEEIRMLDKMFEEEHTAKINTAVDTAMYSGNYDEELEGQLTVDELEKLVEVG